MLKPFIRWGFGRSSLTPQTTSFKSASIWQDPSRSVLSGGRERRDDAWAAFDQNGLNAARRERAEQHSEIKP